MCKLFKQAIISLLYYVCIKIIIIGYSDDETDKRFDTIFASNLI